MKIAIAGYGMEGESNYNYWNNPDNQLTIVDESDNLSYELPIGAQTILGFGAFEKLKDFDVVVRTASLNPNKIKTNGKIWSATNEFFEKCPAPIIGVTGTKGKGTTCSLITSILRAGGKTVHLVGNIGTPALSVLQDIKPDDLVVYELSSFQLWDLEKSPHIAVVLMIEPDHLNIHVDFAEYLKAKSQIVSHQTSDDTAIYSTNNEYSTEIAQGSRANKISCPDKDFAHVKEGYFYYGTTKLCSISQLKLPGNHNIENACAAIDAAWSYVNDGAIIGLGLSVFEGLPHRLHFVRELDGVLYYDDSIATTPGSAIAAIRSFNQPKILILGGSDKGSDFSELYKVIIQFDVKNVITIGSMGDEISKSLRKRSYENVIELGMTNMGVIVDTAHSLAESGDVVIMSPACASFDMFSSYQDRGAKFIAAINQL